MKRTSPWSLAIIACALACACGATEVSDQAKRKSDRFYEAAVIAWREERDNLRAIRHLTQSVRENPGNDAAHYLLGTIYLGRQELELAEEHLRKAVELRGPTRPAARAEALNSLGVLLIQRGKHTEAVEALREAAEEVLNREPWLALGNLGWAYIELGQLDDAIAVLKRSLFDQPMFCVGLYRLGQAHYLKGEHEEAEKRLRSAVAVPEVGCSEMQEAHQLLGMCYLRMGKDDKARSSLERCRDLAPESETGETCSEALEGF